MNQILDGGWNDDLGTVVYEKKSTVTYDGNQKLINA